MSNVRRWVGTKQCAPKKIRAGSVMSFNHDGMEVARVRRRRRQVAIPMRETCLFLVLAMSVKMVTYTDLGPSGYAQRAANLWEGNLAERVVATAMKLDGVTEAAAIKLRQARRGLAVIFS